MKLWVLGSGSRGNAIVLESGACRVLIDVGFGPRILQKRLRLAGLEPESIEACVITHEHSDHLRGAAKAVKRWGWPVFATHGTVSESRLDPRQVRMFHAGATLSFSELDVCTFATPHDAAEPVGVVVTARSTGARAAVCTDIGHASENVRSICSEVDILVLESNHDEHMLWNGPYPPWLCRRIAGDNGHLSNRACGELVRDSVTSRLRQVVLAHLSEKNNLPKVAYEAMKRGIRGTGFRGAIVPAAQDAVLGPFTARAYRGAGQLELGL